MSERSVQESYTDVLKAYMVRQDEELLARAQELGRKLVADAIPTEQIGEIHAKALGEVAKELSSRASTKAIRLTTALLIEMLIGFGLAFREQAETKKKEEKARRQVEKQPLQSQKMETVGLLAWRIAHDFNNLLTTISEYAQMIVNRLNRGDPMRGDAEEVKRAAHRGALLTRQLRAFSRKQVLQPRILNFSAVIMDMDRMLRGTIGEDIELVANPAPALHNVYADPGQIEQVIMTLAANARDAMPKGGKLTIETANVEFDEEYARLHADVDSGSYVMLAVSDTGIGMDEETLSHILEPSPTTKGPGRGTWLGISAVYGIVKQSGGHIRVQRQPGQGATFKVYLPQIEEAD